MRSILFIAALVLTLSTTAQDINIENGLYCKKGAVYSGPIKLMDNTGKTQSLLMVVDGKLQGEAIYYYESGKIMETGSFIAGVRNGTWIRMDENGNKTGEGQYFNGQKHGKWFIWDENGNKRYEMSYIHGEKASTWYNWDENGTLVASANYEKM